MAGSGWFIHPGKLKLDGGAPFAVEHPWFRMVYPSGEVETPSEPATPAQSRLFRMVYPSGEVETAQLAHYLSRSS